MRMFIEKVINSLQGKTTKIYLILANIILVIFAIWFSNVGLLPFSNTGDFLFFVVLGLLFAIYRPGWAFVFFIGSIALENINLAPQSFGLAIRPYQLLGALIIVALIIRAAMKKLPLPAGEFFPKFKWYDVLPIVFALGGFLSSFTAENKAISFKQSIVALSFVALYFLVRIYIQSFSDLKRVAPFFLSSAIVVTLYGILQNIVFIHGGNSFEIMPGRPNATFTEPDWYGIYLVFALAALFVLIYKNTCHSERSVAEPKNPGISLENCNITGSFSASWRIRMTVYYIFLILIFIALILTVSRGAWLGTIFVTIGFLKIILTNRSLRISEWNWKKFLYALQILAVALICSIAVVYVFGLTRFQIFNRASSVAGLQKITIACSTELGSESEPSSDLVISNIDELAQYGCRHIDLEDIEKEKSAGNNVSEIYRNDPNVNIRAEIYKKSWQQIKQHPILGIGWGNIGAILGTDERGTGLNASNIFMEVWLGAGLLGVLSFVILLGYILIASVLAFISNNDRNKNGVAIVFVMLGWAAIVIPNIFNSGIFLGFIWAYLAIAVSLIEVKK